jgi:hypothetical protein
VRRATSARAALAQSAEHLTRNEKVKGSIPLGGSTSITRPLPWIPQVSGFFLPRPGRTRLLALVVRCGFRPD